MKKINAIIVDDEPMARSVLRGIIEESFADKIDIVEECPDVPSAVKAINKKKPELVFLDIEMPVYNGFDLIDFFDDEQLNFKIIFVTAYNEYALQAFQIAAVDYILKPVRTEHIQSALQKLESIGIQFNESKKYKTLQENSRSTKSHKIVLQTMDNIFVLEINEIIYISAQGSYTIIHTESNGEMMFSRRLNTFEHLEKENDFYRVHRSFLVNLHKVKKVDKRSLTITLTNGDCVSLSLNNKIDFLEKIAQLYNQG